MSFEDILHQVEKERLKKLKKCGWSQLTGDTYDLVWKKFYKHFDFKPSVDPKYWPSIKEPARSKTYDVGNFWEKDDETRACMASGLADLYRLAFLSLRGTHELIHALDWQHSCYSFHPETNFDHIIYEEWLVPPMPNGDYYIFVTADMSQGFFGHPWEQTICAFGDQVLESIRRNPISLLTRQIRQNGQDIK